MEYIEGADLQKVVRGAGAMPLGPSLEIISEVASALDVAYMTPGPTGVPLQLLHRDIKPPNILITAAGEIKVLDFGIAKAEFGGREAHTKSVLYGSLGYMAPERLEFEELPAGDVYALGTVLFELLDGSPFGKSFIHPQKHQAAVDESVDRLLKKLGSVPAEFPELLKSMLAYDPTERPSAREVERRCRALRGAVGEPWLRDWAEQVVPPLLAKPSELQQDNFSGSIVTERSMDVTEGITTEFPAGDEASVDKAVPAAEKQPPPTRPRPAPRRSGMGGILVAVGCVTILSVGALLAGGIVATGGLLALNQSYEDTGVPPPTPERPPSPPSADPGDVDLGFGSGLGTLGAATIVPPIEPWQSMGLPIGTAAILSSDETSIVFSETGTNIEKMAGRFGATLTAQGWTLTGNYRVNSGTLSQTWSQGARSLSLAGVDYQGMTIVTLSIY
jgi:hypothetical protein